MSTSQTHVQLKQVGVESQSRCLSGHLYTSLKYLIILKNKDSDDLMKRLLNEYKEGKAYRYFTGEWVKDIFYHEVHEKSDKCIMKAS